jgi:hypothetical protein
MASADTSNALRGRADLTSIGMQRFLSGAAFRQS